MAPIPEAIFLVNLSIWLLQVSLSSISTPSDLAIVICSIGEPLIEGLEGTISRLGEYHRHTSLIDNLKGNLVNHQYTVKIAAVLK